MVQVIERTDKQVAQYSMRLFLNDSTLCCFQVIGTRGCGKTGLLQGLLGRTLRYQSRLKKDQISKFTINTVPVHGQEKYLLLHEVSGGEIGTASSSSCSIVVILLHRRHLAPSSSSCSIIVILLHRRHLAPWSSSCSIVVHRLHHRHHHAPS